jgi:hypothetical protein
MTYTYPAPTTQPSPPRSSGARTAWITFGSLFAVVALAYGVMSAVGLLSYAKKDTHVAFARQGVARIDIDNAAGSTHIVGTDGDEIVVDAEVTYGVRDPRNDSHVDGDTLVVRSSCPFFPNQPCSVDYTIRVPTSVAVIARGAGGGIHVEDVDGPLDVSASGGGVRLERVSGPLRVRSSGGGVRGTDLRSDVVDVGSSGGGVRLAFLVAPTSVDAASSGGGVTVELPDTPDPYNIEATSSGGSVRADDVRRDPASARRIDVSSSGGGVTVRYAES